MFVYIVRCSDGTFYTGVTRNIVRRIQQHNGELRGGAKYTRSRRLVVLVYIKPCLDLGSALRLERAIKKLSHAAKARL